MKKRKGEKRPSSLLQEVLERATEVSLRFEGIEQGPRRGLTSGTLRETSGSPARGAGSNCRLHGRKKARSAPLIEARGEDGCTHKVYFMFSSISMIAAWLPQR